MLGDTIYGKLKDLQIIALDRNADEYYVYCQLSTNNPFMRFHEMYCMKSHTNEDLLISDLETQQSYYININLCKPNEFSVRKRLEYNHKTKTHDISDVIFAKIENGDFIFLDHENNYRAFDKDNNPLDGQGNLEETIFYMKLKAMI